MPDSHTFDPHMDGGFIGEKAEKTPIAVAICTCGHRQVTHKDNSGHCAICGCAEYVETSHWPIERNDADTAVAALYCDCGHKLRNHRRKSDSSGMFCLVCACEEYMFNPHPPTKEPEAPSNPDLNQRAIILCKAEDLINGDRAETYGPPEVSFGRIADLWNAMGFLTTDRGSDGEVMTRPLDAVDVSLALLQLKVSRIISSPDHADSWIDAAGYVALGGELAG